MMPAFMEAVLPRVSKCEAPLLVLLPLSFQFFGYDRVLGMIKALWAFRPLSS